MTKFPDMGQMAKIPWYFFKIPWLFPDLEKILFFPDISPARSNPGLFYQKVFMISQIEVSVFLVVNMTSENGTYQLQQLFLLWEHLYSLQYRTHLDIWCAVEFLCLHSKILLYQLMDFL